MKKIAPVVFCLIVLSVWRVGADTVCITIAADGRTKATESAASFLVDGIMEILFEAGHVAFDEAFVLTTYEEFRAPNFGLSYARADGADFAVMAFMDFPDSLSVFPARTFFRLVDVVTGKKLAERELSDSVAAEGGVAEAGIVDVAARAAGLGRIIAKDVVEAMAQ